MFNFFCNLAIAIYSGSWQNFGNRFFVNAFIDYMKVSPIFNMFNNSTENYYQTTITSLSNDAAIPPLAVVISCVLSAICCISVFWLIVRSIYRLFQFLTFER